jgi:hypothetical protein
MVAALVVRVRRAILPAETRGGPSMLGRVPKALALEGIRLKNVDLGAFGELETDEIPPRTGTDVIVLGDAVCREPSAATRVEVSVGGYDLKLDVFGRRVWDSVLGSLMPTAAEPFTRMPLTYANAYGGAPASDYGPIPLHANPIGKGHYFSPTQARDAELPNVESSSAKHIAAWDDHPEPVGVAPYPSVWGLRTDRYTRFDPETERIEIMPEQGMYDRAHPLLSGIFLRDGEGEEGLRLRIKGMTDTGYLDVPIPECPYEAALDIGPTSLRRALEIEELLVDLRPTEGPEVGIIDITYRKMFRYRVVPFQRRETRLVARRTRSDDRRAIHASNG